MATSAHLTSSLHSLPMLPAVSQPHTGLEIAPDKKEKALRCGETSTRPATVFDLLYDEYLPFRLYADYMLGSSTQQLAKEYRVSEHWVAERIEALRLCIGKQVRVNLLDSAERSLTLH